VGSFIRIGTGIEEGEPSSCAGTPRGVVPGGHKLHVLSPPRVLRSQNLPKTKVYRFSETFSRKAVFAWDTAQQRPGKRALRRKHRSCSSGGWSAEDVSQKPGSGCRLQEPWLRRYSWKKVPQIYIAISWGAADHQMHNVISALGYRRTCLQIQEQETVCTVPIKTNKEKNNNYFHMLPVTSPRNRKFTLILKLIVKTLIQYWKGINLGVQISGRILYYYSNFKIVSEKMAYIEAGIAKARRYRPLGFWNR
jgi:hypothetical protein